MSAHPGRISGIQPQTVRKDRVNISIEGSFAFSLSLDSLVAHGLRVGDQLTAEQIASLESENQAQKCRDAALNFLGPRPRSMSETHTRLRQKGFSDEDITITLNWLKERGYLNDEAFASFWTENRQNFRPRSARVIRAELAQKGIERDIAAEATNDLDEDDSAYRAAVPRARRFAGLDQPNFQKKIAEFLVRRGFSYEIAMRASRRIWNESQGTVE